jgi:hemerythrin-like domain-containing protein
MKPIVDVTVEHGIIRVMLRVLEKICGKIESGETVPAEHFWQVLTFISEFVDKCHHGKEEKFLFPVMRESQFPDEHALVDELMEEHAAGRNFALGMAEAMKVKDFVCFSQNARGYISLVDRHIDKENNVFFPMAEKTLSNEKKNEMEVGFEDFEKNVIGEGRHNELREMALGMKSVYI